MSHTHPLKEKHYYLYSKRGGEEKHTEENHAPCILDEL